MSTPISTRILEACLNLATNEERLALTQIFQEKASKPLPNATLLDQILREGGHGISNLVRGRGVAYAELLCDACDTLKVENAPSIWKTVHEGRSLNAVDQNISKDAEILPEQLRFRLINDKLQEFENRLLAQLLKNIYEGLSEADKARFDAALAKVTADLADNSLKGLSTTAAIIALGNMGGFATYMLMSTVLSTLTFGALSFGAYTLASSMLSVLLGPIGWTALGLAAIYTLGSPNEKKVVRLAATCAMISQRVRKDHRQAIRLQGD